MLGSKVLKKIYSTLARIIIPNKFAILERYNLLVINVETVKTVLNTETIRLKDVIINSRLTSIIRLSGILKIESKFIDIGNIITIIIIANIILAASVDEKYSLAFLLFPL